MTILKSKVERDIITDRISSASDFAWTGENSFTVPSFDMPKDFGIGLIVGPSGSGKSSILKTPGVTLSSLMSEKVSRATIKWRIS